MAFIETNILPRYTQFDRAHGLPHVTRVINQSVKLAKTIGADINMAYAIAAYHDLGLEGPRAIHHLTSGKIIASDARLKKWFSSEQIKVMKEAVEDHRASASHAPRSIYGKIVAEADALGCALHEAGDVRRHKAPLRTHPHHTQHRREGGKVVVRDFRLGRADGGEQGRFANVGVAY